jgi:hypothetical protein
MPALLTSIHLRFELAVGVIPASLITPRRGRCRAISASMLSIRPNMCADRNW